MHFVYNINLKTAFGRRIGYLIHNFADVIDAVVGSGVISITFMLAPAAMERQLRHSPQGEPSTGFSQLTAFANILAMVVFAGPSCPAEQIGMADSIRLYLIS